MSQIPHNFFVARKLYRFGYQTISFFIVFEIYAEWWFVWNLFFHLTLIVCKGKGAHILGVDDMHTKRIFPLEKCCALWAACAAAVLAACSVPALQTIVQFQALKFANILVILLFLCLIWDPSSFPSWKAACVAAVLAACSIYALQTITVKSQVEACVNNQKNQVFGGAINWDMSLIMSCLYCCYSRCLLSSCFTNVFEFSFFLFCMFTFSLSISSITFEPVINVCPKGNWLFLHGLFLVLRFLKLGKFLTSNFKVFITLYCDCSVLLCRLIH